MKKILLIITILSLFILSSCWKEENMLMIKDPAIKENMLQLAKKEYSNFYIREDTTWKEIENWKIKFSDSWRSFDFKWIDCENVIPLIEIHINWYNKDIWFVDVWWNTYKEWIWLYKNEPFKYGKYVELNSKWKDKNDVCIYWISLFDSKWLKVKTIDDTQVVYKDWIIQYNNKFWLDLYDDRWYFFNDPSEEDYNNDIYTDSGHARNILKWYENWEPKKSVYKQFNQLFLLYKFDVKYYLDNLSNVISYIETDFNFKAHHIDRSWINKDRN